MISYKQATLGRFRALAPPWPRQKVNTIPRGLGKPKAPWRKPASDQAV
jgi:hypothetical protein